MLDYAAHFVLLSEPLAIDMQTQSKISADDVTQYVVARWQDTGFKPSPELVIQLRFNISP